MSNPLELGLQMVVSHVVGAGNLTWIPPPRATNVLIAEPALQAPSWVFRGIFFLFLLFCVYPFLFVLLGLELGAFSCMR